ncbi:sensor histidine kinase [Actinomadura sp. KC345]|uniref:sensor histidine kinase n=1 Tax=Actinomadura sp. KC345 TaxID=2530371 RepID=UPI00105407D4|nr:sensor histidine kinase [Actinomadura sp. KC345]TDC56542.1 sensor histidine kinase [Actinomadura sp. KC345]
MGGWPELRGRLTDKAVATGVLVLVAVGSSRPLIAPGSEPWATTVITSVLIVIGCGALYFSRRFPVTAALVAVVATGAYYILSLFDGPLMIAPIVALYMIAAQGRLQAAVAVAAVIVIATGAGTLSGNGDVNSVALFMQTGWIVAMVALGWVRHSRRVFLQEAEQRAAGEERLRIARELHDVAGHHISLINVQAGTALHRFKRDPAQAEAALAAIKESSRDALRDLRTTIGVLRKEDEGAPTAPAPGIDRIGELVESARAAGLTVRSRVTGDGGPLPTGVDLATYRIVQESLTNVVRHASATTVTVCVEREPRAVVVEISDDGRGAAPDAAGSGVHGMRERARALGGELTAGPGPDGGFLVRARLPHPNGAS